MKWISLVVTILLVSFFSVRAINDDRFIAGAAWMIMPLVIGYILNRGRVMGLSEIGWGMLYGSLTVMIVALALIIFGILTWKMPKLF